MRRLHEAPATRRCVKPDTTPGLRPTPQPSAGCGLVENPLVLHALSFSKPPTGAVALRDVTKKTTMASEETTAITRYITG